MWYKDETNASHTYLAESSDLYHWEVGGPVITDCAHEGPNVFFWKGRYWMVTDTWNGLGVYGSSDATNWIRQPGILGTPGARVDDGQNGLHADVLVQDKRAFIFYFTHPDRSSGDEPADPHPLWFKRTSIQVAELDVRDGVLVCDRNASFDFTLKPPAVAGSG